MSCCGKLNKFNQKKFNETDAVIDMKGGDALKDQSKHSRQRATRIQKRAPQTLWIIDILIWILSHSLTP